MWRPQLWDWPISYEYPAHPKKMSQLDPDPVMRKPQAPTSIQIGAITQPGTEPISPAFSDFRNSSCRASRLQHLVKMKDPSGTESYTPGNNPIQTHFWVDFKDLLMHCTKQKTANAKARLVRPGFDHLAKMDLGLGKWEKANGSFCQPSAMYQCRFSSYCKWNMVIR